MMAPANDNTPGPSLRPEVIKLRMRWEPRRKQIILPIEVKTQEELEQHRRDINLRIDSLKARMHGKAPWAGLS